MSPVDPSEALQRLHDDISKLSGMKIDIGYIKRDIGEIKNSISDFKKDYVSQSEFDTYKWIVRSCVVGLIAQSVALIYQ